MTGRCNVYPGCLWQSGRSVLVARYAGDTRAIGRQGMNWQVVWRLWRRSVARDGRKEFPQSTSLRSRISGICGQQIGQCLVLADVLRLHCVQSISKNPWQAPGFKRLTLRRKILKDLFMDFRKLALPRFRCFCRPLSSRWHGQLIRRGDCRRQSIQEIREGMGGRYSAGRLACAAHQEGFDGRGEHERAECNFYDPGNRNKNQPGPAQTTHDIQFFTPAITLRRASYRI